MRCLSICILLQAACHPAANGAIERLVRSFKGILAYAYYMSLNTKCKSHPTGYMSGARAIGVVLFEMLHGCTPKLDVPAAFGKGSLSICEEYDITEYVDSLQQHFQALDNQAFAMFEQQFRAIRVAEAPV
jgi:hypothetical protein